MTYRKIYPVIFTVLLIGAGPPVHADKPAAPGNNGNVDRSAAQDANPLVYFTDDRVASIRTYYSDQQPKHQGAGGCPPGLAKKNNGCLPPGQAKKWRRGEALPPGIVVYDLPGDLQVVLGGVPQGRKVVRVDEDLLLISIATGVVLEALEL